MRFEIDERFADIVFTKEPYFKNTTSLIIYVDHDPADNCFSLEISGIYGIDIINLGEQNVISHAEFSKVEGSNIGLYVEEFKKEGAHVKISKKITMSDKFLSIILVGANGASIYAICKSFSKTSKSDDVIHMISV